MRPRSIGRRATAAVATVVVALGFVAASAAAQAPPPRLTLGQLVTPSTRVPGAGGTVRFALHGLIEFETLEALFAYIDEAAGRWTFESPAARQAFADDLLRRSVESRVVSMQTELPLEILLTHTQAEVEAAVREVSGGDGARVFAGQHWQLSGAVYREAFTRVRERWSRSLNCWSASSSLPGRVLSNWYVIDEGITLYGARYDSTEHFWQAVKFHPDTTVGDVRRLLGAMRQADFQPWLEALAADQRFYFAHAYAVEFLKRNLTPERLGWYDSELARVATPDTGARAAQQRADRAAGAPPRFLPVDEKVLWGDIADVLHLVVVFSGSIGKPLPPAASAVRAALVAAHFDAIYLPGYGVGRMDFLSPAFQALMLEIWKVKYLQMPRFGEVIRSTTGRRLDHFLNDGDSPDIPIPIYVGYLNRIREMALETRK
jgi:hypothetical protein